MNNIKQQTSNKVIFQLISLTATLILLLLFSPLSYLSLLGVLFTIYILNELVFGFGKGIPINIVIVFIASLQWIIGPILSYYTGIVHPFYGMQVPEEEYMSFVLPGVMFYHFGLSLPIIGVSHIPKIVINDLENETSNKIKGAYYLIALGFFASFAYSFAPGSLAFFFVLLSNLKFIGCFYLYLSNAKNKKILYFIYSSLLLQSLAAALFHDLLLWSMFFLFIYCIKNKVSIKTRFSVLVIGFFMVFVLQSVKYQYRTIAWTDTTLDTFDQVELFFSMVGERLTSPEILFDVEANEVTITRLNQGWIITRVMNYVPYIRPYADGETIEEAFSAAFLPRFLYQNKAVAGGREKMVRFTGIELQQGTSMNISLIGEGYGNFGRSGGVVFMFLIGIAFSLILRYILKLSLRNPTYIFWIPFLYMQVVKAETDLTTTLNYIVKASIVMVIVFYGFRRILKIDI
ncbi:hypothetical protein [Pontibacter beigongshangensis]|uniref:hypothetical protein n=1 Tax=Pontibacter beigongshangensis TaxID=2574733 RepID=UPI0016504D29|nr:hypothetical protein [Pontibacter beigongshangensis]